MARKKLYLTLDTETCTLPFADSICESAEQKKKLAIGKPICYDIAWTVTDSKGREMWHRNYVVAETFFQMDVFNTAYYKSKRPLYYQMIETGETKVERWGLIIFDLMQDLAKVDLTLAFNAAFDFKRSIPYTERYIQALYSADYFGWLKEEKRKSKRIIEGVNTSKNENYLVPVLNLRGFEYPIADLWGLACDLLINNNRYKKWAMENSRFTPSGLYFSTTAENVFSYLVQHEGFVESHTALDDAWIESYILYKILQKRGIKPIIEAFPFQRLGGTIDYTQKKSRKKYQKVVKQAIYDYLNEKNGFTKAKNHERYWTGIVNKYKNLEG